METIQNFYFALYAKACVEITQNDEIVETTQFDDITFYDKQFYCAHLYPSTYKKIYNIDCEDLVIMAKFYIDEENYNENVIDLHPEEWIEDLSESAIVCTDPETNKEIDAFDFVKSYGYSCNSTESGYTKFSAWCDESDLP
jgi:hypothetical protein